jgi:hypothetical protein
MSSHTKLDRRKQDLSARENHEPFEVMFIFKFITAQYLIKSRDET